MAETKMPITTDTITEKLRLHKQLVCTSAYDYTSACAVRGAGCIDVLFVLVQEVAQCAYGLESAAALSLEVSGALLYAAGEFL